MSFQKYLKYKNKYLSLKNMVGGSTNNLNNNLIYVGYYTKFQNDGSYGGREEEVNVYQYWNTDSNQVQGQTTKMWNHDNGLKIR